jgi:iron complex outermembrane receptor protein
MATALAVAAAGVPFAGSADEGADDAPSRSLGTVTVIGRRPSSLPTQIPTTIEGIAGTDVRVRINATDAEDALKYFPSLVVRKRYIGDYDHAVLATRASGTNNSARSVVYADGILISNLLGNGATFTPRWGLVTPEEIERVDVLYGPFSAAYPGNSVGAVVDYVTRMPTELEVHAAVSSFGEDFHIYRSEGTYSGQQASASVGSAHGRGRGGSTSIASTATRTLSATRTSCSARAFADPGGTPVTGALEDRNPREQDWLILGSTTATHTIQDHAKAKVAYEISPQLRVAYTLGIWDNDSERSSETYLRDAAGNPVYSGAINVDGRRYTLTPADFAPTTGDLRHLMHGLSLKGDAEGPWSFELAASSYDYDRDLTRSPTVALPDAATGGAGRIGNQEGTGWSALALRFARRPDDADGHILDLGLQVDDFRLRTLVDATDDWLVGGPTARVSAFRGDTALTSVYAQDTWAFAPQWRATLGARVERWQAANGSISDATTTLAFAERTETYVSPKLALARELTPQWSLKASVGRAIRMPTVAELYQGSIAANAIVNNDPNLRPEKSWTSELSGERVIGSGSMRLTAFFEDTVDALYSQTNVTVTPNVTNIQNVDEIATRGLEAALTQPGLLGGKLDVSASVTYARSIIERNDNFPASVGKWQPRVPDWRANAFATYRFSEAWSLTAGGRYSGTQYNTLDNGDTNPYTFTGTSPFIVFDLRARYASDRWSASLGVDNVGDEEYWAFHPYTRRNFIAELGVNF